jgi:hypothetical protein
MQGWSAHRRDGWEALRCNGFPARLPGLPVVVSLGPLCHQINACAFSQYSTDAHWHRALEHDCTIRPIDG